ncbi:MAG TPA: hypothetical protein VMS43_14005 [Allosphingosinicella sp.]|nr:hypothetical protein [Allosphingosinicella sp.]
MSAAANAAWPPEREAELIRRYCAGERVKVIAFGFGVSSRSLRYQIERLQRAGTLAMRNKGWSPAEDIALLQAVGAGDKAAQLTGRFGRSEEAIRMRAIKLRCEQRQAQADAERAFAAPRGEAAPAVADLDQFTLELRAA